VLRRDQTLCRSVKANEVHHRRFGQSRHMERRSE
jgi:hypothetical protein